MHSPLLYFSGRTCTSAVNSDGKGPIANDDVNNADSKRMPDGYENCRSENDSLPSTSKQDPESKYWKSNVGQKQQTSDGPVFYSGGVNSSTTERGNGFERSVICSTIFFARSCF